MKFIDLIVFLHCFMCCCNCVMETVVKENVHGVNLGVIYDNINFIFLTLHHPLFVFFS